MKILENIKYMDKKVDIINMLVPLVYQKLFKSRY